MKKGVLKMLNGDGVCLAQVPLRSHALYFFRCLHKSQEATRIDLYVDGHLHKRYPISCIHTEDARLFATQDMMMEVE